jgi:hypothetical protein
MAFKSVKFNSGCSWLIGNFWWKTAFYLPNIRPENSTAAGSMKALQGAPRTALAAFTYGVLHLMARIFN